MTTAETVAAELAALNEELSKLPEDFLTGDADLIADQIERATAEFTP